MGCFYEVGEREEEEEKTGGKETQKSKNQVSTARIPDKRQNIK